MAASWEAGLSLSTKLRRAITAARAGTLEVEDAREAIGSAKRSLASTSEATESKAASLDFLVACCKSARPSAGLGSVLQQLTPEIAACLPHVISSLPSAEHQEQAVAIFIHYSRAVQSLTGVLGILSKFGFCSEDVSRNGNRSTHASARSRTPAPRPLYNNAWLSFYLSCRILQCWLRSTVPASCSRPPKWPARRSAWTARPSWLD